jgi:dihydrofolate reductase
VASAWQSGGVTKTQYFTATSLDGYIADQDNSLAWLFEVDRRQGNDDSFARFFAEIGAMAMGATTYEWVLDHEQLLDHPEKWRAYTVRRHAGYSPTGRCRRFRGRTSDSRTETFAPFIRR